MIKIFLLNCFDVLSDLKQLNCLKVLEMTQNYLKLVKMAQNDPKWPKCLENFVIWFCHLPFEEAYCNVLIFAVFRSKVSGQIWTFWPGYTHGFKKSACEPEKYANTATGKKAFFSSKTGFWNVIFAIKGVTFLSKMCVTLWKIGRMWPKFIFKIKLTEGMLF